MNEKELVIIAGVSERELVIEHVKERLIEAFTKGDLVDARNIEAFITSLEGMSDQEYNERAAEECSGAIS